MTTSGVEIVAEAFAAFNARDAERLVELSHPDCEWFPFRAQLEGTSYRGHEGILRFMRDMDDDWVDFRIDPLELSEHGDDVLAIGRVSATGRGSGVAIDFVGGFVLGLENARVKRLMSYNNPDDARRAVGA